MKNEFILPRLLRLLFLICSFVVLFFLFALSLLLASFGAPAGFAGTLTLIAGVWLAWKQKSQRIFLLTPLVWGILNLVLIVQSLRIYNHERDRYMSVVSAGGELEPREKVNVYVLNIFMSLCAWPLYPEVARESFLLMFPCDKGERRITGAFFLDSKLVQKKIRGMKAGDSVSVRWSGNDYVLGRREARYALALNPCRITLLNSAMPRRYEARVSVSYPPRSKVAVIGGPLPLYVEEGLFAYLQRCGWLYPYEAVWVGVAY